MHATVCGEPKVMTPLIFCAGVSLDCFRVVSLVGCYETLEASGHTLVGVYGVSESAASCTVFISHFVLLREVKLDSA
jgi:hypothetical protein